MNYFLKFEMLEISRKNGRLALQFSDRSKVLVETLGEVNHHVLKKMYMYTHAILNAVGKKISVSILSEMDPDLALLQRESERSTAFAVFVFPGLLYK